MRSLWLARPIETPKGKRSDRFLIYFWNTEKKQWKAVGGAILEFGTDRWFAYIAEGPTAINCNRPSLVRHISRGRFVTCATLRGALKLLKEAYPDPLHILTLVEEEWMGVVAIR